MLVLGAASEGGGGGGGGAARTALSALALVETFALAKGAFGGLGVSTGAGDVAREGEGVGVGVGVGDGDGLGAGATAGSC